MAHKKKEHEEKHHKKAHSEKAMPGHKMAKEPAHKAKKSHARGK